MLWCLPIDHGCAHGQSKGFAATRNGYRSRHTGKHGYMRMAACRVAPSPCILEVCSALNETYGCG